MNPSPQKNGRSHRSARSGWILLLPLLALPGCGGGNGVGGGRPAGPEIARVSTKSLTADSFQEYLVDVFGSREAIETGDELLSRLLDQYLEEQLYLVKAEQLGIEASDEEVRQQVERMTTGNEDIGWERFRDRFRDSMAARKLKDQVVAQRVDVLPEEIEEFYRRNPERFRVPRVIRLRQILVDDELEAKRIREELAKDVERFQMLAAEHSLSPEKGRARAYEEEELPAEVREAVAGLKDQELTSIVQDSQGFHVFQLVGKAPDQALPLSEVKREIERELFRKKSEEVLSRFLEDLRREIPVEIVRENLSFEYVEVE